MHHRGGQNADGLEPPPRSRIPAAVPKRRGRLRAPREWNEIAIKLDRCGQGQHRRGVQIKTFPTTVGDDATTDQPPTDDKLNRREDYAERTEPGVEVRISRNEVRGGEKCRVVRMNEAGKYPEIVAAAQLRLTITSAWNII